MAECCELSTIKPAVDERLYHSRYTKLIIFIIFLGAFACGMAIYWEASILFHHAPHVSLQATHCLAIALSSIVTSLLLPHLGRRYALVYCSLAFVPAVIINALLQGLHPCDLLARLLSGAAIGAFATSVVVFVGEIALPLCRGRYYALLTLSYYLGGFLYFGLYYFHPYLSMGALILTLLFIVLGLIYLPATPYFVEQQGHSQYAREVLYFLRCGSLDRQNEELQTLQAYVRDYPCFHRGWGMLDRFLTLFLLAKFTHLTGFSWFVIVSHEIQLFPYMHAMIVFLCGLLGWLFYYLMIKKLGRSTVLITSSSGTLLANALLSAYFACIFFMRTTISAILYVAVALFFFGYFLGLAHMFFLLAGEIFPYKNKHYCVAYAVVGYFVIFSFGGFLTRELLLALGPFLTSCHYVLQSILAIIFGAFVMPGYNTATLLQCQLFFDGVEI